MPLDWNTTYSIPLDIKGFKGPLRNLNTSADPNRPSEPFRVTAEELVGAAMMVGHPAQQLGFWALIHRASIVLGYLDGPETSPSPGEPVGVWRSNDYLTADPSEKNAISYYLGLYAVKAIAARVLDVRQLIHYDQYLRSRGEIPAGTRPDLIGWSKSLPQPGACFVIEAKGRSGRHKGSALAHTLDGAKGQLAKVVVPGPLGAGIASVAHFDKDWHVAWRDPDVEVGAPLNEDDRAFYLAAYYEPVLRFVREMTRLGSATEIRLTSTDGRDDGISFLRIDVPGSDIHVAVPADAVDALPEGPIVLTVPTTGQRDDSARAAAFAVSAAFLNSSAAVLGDIVRPTTGQQDELQHVDRARPRRDRETDIEILAYAPEPSRWIEAAPRVLDDNETWWTFGTDGVAVRLGTV